MKLKVEINLDNAAFEPDAGTEAARLLRQLANDIDGNRLAVAGSVKSLRDVNGNAVGKAQVVKG